MLSKKELLKSLLGKKVCVLIFDSGIKIDHRNNFHEITKIGEDVFEVTRYISGGENKIGYYSIDHVVSIDAVEG